MLSRLIKNVVNTVLGGPPVIPQQGPSAQDRLISLEKKLDDELERLQETDQQLRQYQIQLEEGFRQLTAIQQLTAVTQQETHKKMETDLRSLTFFAKSAINLNQNPTRISQDDININYGDYSPGNTL